MTKVSFNVIICYLSFSLYTLTPYINKHVVEPGGTISPCGKIFQNLIGGGKFFSSLQGGIISFSIRFPRHVIENFLVEIFQGGGK